MFCYRSHIFTPRFAPSSESTAPSRTCQPFFSKLCRAPQSTMTTTLRGTPALPSSIRHHICLVRAKKRWKTPQVCWCRPRITTTPSWFACVSYCNTVQSLPRTSLSLSVVYEMPLSGIMLTVLALSSTRNLDILSQRALVLQRSTLTKSELMPCLYY